MTRWLYTLVVWALQPLLRAKLQRRGRVEPGYLQAMDERFGHYTQAPVAVGERGYVWVHAVSLGETRAAAVLLQALRSTYPGVRIVLTHGTATGRAQGSSVLQPGDVQVWQPWDTPAVVQRFLNHFKPQLGLVLETEVWPNWVALCQRAHVPLVLVNARMSEKSLRQAQRLSWLSRPAYAGLSAVWAQTEADAQRLRALGASVQGVLGNLKFDAQPDAQQLAQALVWAQRLTRPVIVLASSREGEEVLWLDALQALKDDPLDQRDHVNAVHWLVVPRHPQRFDDVAHMLQQRGWQVSRRSQWRDGPDATGEADVNTVWLGDSLGEMALYYGLADAALLGGSFAPLGGQNLIEATACGCPVLMGPHTFNFAEAAELAEEAGAALRVEDMAHAIVTALQMVRFGPDENAQVAACLAFSQQHRGAAQHTVQALAPYLKA
ncbi:3-deoxy-D-manno-octulosonic acid transferase [Limnohabitans sp. JirII-31]|uniref:3-deoxy-D-manno-octulosonic acid transferase n=1 Tax=Limnohabitans sp. JirII-31 TaxID=1977908 RepID=UPI000C1E4366|nr:3-deoxy-D-manno-octulosonic acid transferase [Limnohabitans sp. JirII-31]PIT73844.1 3-deoxy-D-manno-octulosonic acid transferase [Limnohabitans sp. JirII-31]